MSKKPKLRKATAEDLKKGSFVIVEDIRGHLTTCEVTHTLGPKVGQVAVPVDHEIQDDQKLYKPYTWSFVRNDFEDGEHGDYGLKLWVRK